MKDTKIWRGIINLGRQITSTIQKEPSFILKQILYILYITITNEDTLVLQSETDSDKKPQTIEKEILIQNSIQLTRQELTKNSWLRLLLKYMYSFCPKQMLKHHKC